MSGEKPEENKSTKICPKCGNEMRQDPDGKEWVCMIFQCQYYDPIIQPEEYVITGKQLNALQLELPPSIIKDLCSRPLSDEIRTANPFNRCCFGKFPDCPCDDECTVAGNCETYFKTIEDAIKKVRGDVLDELYLKATNHESYKHVSERIISPENPTISISTLKRDIESLRGDKP
jgi:hypothetical protein